MTWGGGLSELQNWDVNNSGEVCYKFKLLLSDWLEAEDYVVFNCIIGRNK